MTKPFLKPYNPLLRKVSSQIPENEINSEATKKLVQLMLKKILGEQKGKKKGVGLAAIQIGILKRIILVDTKADGKKRVKGKLEVFINPEIIWKSKRQTEWYEGCFSTGQICGIVKRSVSIKVNALKLQSRIVNSNPNRDWKFKLVEEKYTGYVARIFQHEIDHLNGHVFIEKINDPNKLHKVFKKEFSLYRKSWRNWPKKYPLPLALKRLKKV